MKPQAEHSMTDFEKFAKALYSFDSVCKKNDKDNWMLYREFIESIKDLKCDDFRFFFHLAYYQNTNGPLEEAKSNIDKSINLLLSIKDGFSATEENYAKILIPTGGGSFTFLRPSAINVQKAEIYYCAGEIYAKTGLQDKSLEYYKRSHYYKSFLKSEFGDRNSISLFSFRRYNEHSLSDLINNTITVSPSTKMNDPFDSLINLWASEEQLKQTYVNSESKHITPLCKSFKFFRVRSFCIENDKLPVRNILMWSHYAGEHTGFCIKYKLSNHFIKQEDDESNYEHMYLKRITYTDDKVNLNVSTINSDLAFATKHKDWKYENEVRLIVYNPNKTDDFYGIKLDKDSEIEAIFFGYRCSEQTITTIKKLFSHKVNCYMPKFYKMELNSSNVYELNYQEV